MGIISTEVVLMPVLEWVHLQGEQRRGSGVSAWRSGGGGGAGQGEEKEGLRGGREGMRPLATQERVLVMGSGQLHPTEKGGGRDETPVMTPAP